MSVAFCSSEIAPFAKTGGLGDVCGTLPLALEKLKIEPVLVLPRYQMIDPQKYQLKKISPEAWIGTAGQNIPVYFIEQEGYFGRKEIYGEDGGEYSDNLERFHCFCLKALELFKTQKKTMDIIHVHDWQAALIPVLLKSIFRSDLFYKKTKSILSIHNMAFQGIFPKDQFPKLGFDRRLFSMNGLEFYNQINLLKGGLIFSDRVATVSPHYAREIRTPEFGCGLEGVLANRREGVVGILNGLDYETWNPEADVHIKHRYSKDNWKSKFENKSYLQKLVGLPVKRNVPILAFVGRLTYQKGIELLMKAMDKVLALDLQLVFLGVGEPKYEQPLRRLAKKNPAKIAVSLKFSEELAHQIYAGSDLFLMPSVFEPCGLSQMISFRYGTIPLVYRTGGLADTVFPFDPATGEGTGFIFDQYKEDAFLKSLQEALLAYQDRPSFERLMTKVMNSDFSWERSAKEYQKLYLSLLN